MDVIMRSRSSLQSCIHASFWRGVGLWASVMLLHCRSFYSLNFDMAETTATDSSSIFILLYELIS